MSVNLPDLYKLERRFEKQLKSEPMFNEHVSVEMFLQLWPNTACGFDEPGAFSGQAFSEAYTTVFIHTHKKARYSYSDVVFAGVFFGEKLAYTIINPSETFLEDLKARDIACVGDAKERYQTKDSKVNVFNQKPPKPIRHTSNVPVDDIHRARLYALNNNSNRKGAYS